MPLQHALDALRSDPELASGFVEWRELPEVQPRYGAFPVRTDARLIDALARRGVERLYTHQSEALAAVMQRQSVVVVTPTASGKTLCYNLPVLQTILDDPEARALYLFPTKALAQDQMQELYELVTELSVDIKTHTYDGDTPGDARRKVREAGHVVVTNPDMLHTAILPHHTKWVKLFENLRYVVIDELHQYRGVFGSHVANVVRRLRRVCNFYGSDPIFICCSATIANPRELAENIVRKPMHLIDDNGAPRGRKVVAIYNPPVVNRELGIRQSSVGAARAIGSKLLQAGVQTIVFAPSRVRVELLLRYLRESLKQRIGEPPKVEGYRSGYLPNERRAVERGLREGCIRGVVATNALELGIDIGGLDASVLTGFPGTLASAWQQMGRAGRRHGLAFSVLIASSSPLNQYVATNPDYLFDTSPEAGLIDPDNLLVRISHMKCAAFELPFEEAEEYGPDSPELLEMLADEGVLVKAGGRYHWMTEVFPAEHVSLRSAAIDNFVVIEQGPKPRVIGEVDRPAAPLLIHDEAIYMHGGQQYHVDRLDWHEKKAYVRKVDVDYYTDANLAVDLEVLESFESAPAKGCGVDHGEVAVRDVATIFKKIKLDTNENVGWGRISIPEESRHTTGYWFALDEAATGGLGRAALQDGLWGVAHLLRNLAPIFLMCDPRDLQAVAQVRSPFTERPTLFLYENQPGGVGMSRRLFEIHAKLMVAARDLVSACGCPGGCPGCVGPSIGSNDGGSDDRALSTKRSALILLQRLCEYPRPCLDEGVAVSRDWLEMSVASVALRDRLRHAVSVHAAAVRPLPAPVAAEPPPIAQILRGDWRETAHGPVFVRDEWYPLDHQHGTLPLGCALDATAASLACLLNSGVTPAPARLAFFDIETTGLSSGTGTYMVVAGLGSYETAAPGEPPAFRMRQYFLADLAQERAMLAMLADDLARFDGLVTYNGRAFDMPFLQSRLTLSRLTYPCDGLPHFDLLHIVRRLYKHRMPGCRLAEAERRLLRIERPDDVPGSLIPSIYFDYLRAGRVSPLRTVFRHNAEDVLSLVGVLAQTAALFSRVDLDPEDAVAVARWWELAGEPERAAALYRSSLPWLEGGQDWGWAATRHARLCRRSGEREEAAALWRDLWAQGDRASGLELAKHLEHHARDLSAASEVTRALLVRADEAERIALARRLARLERKLQR